MVILLCLALLPYVPRLRHRVARAMTAFYATPNERSPRWRGSFKSGRGSGRDSRYGLTVTSQTVAPNFLENQAFAALWNRS